jgi:hypothetical protein
MIFTITGNTQQLGVGHENVVALFAVKDDQAPFLLAATRANGSGDFSLEWGSDSISNPTEDYDYRLCIVALDDDGTTKLQAKAQDWLGCVHRGKGGVTLSMSDLPANQELNNPASNDVVFWYVGDLDNTRLRDLSPGANHITPAGSPEYDNSYYLGRANAYDFVYWVLGIEDDDLNPQFEFCPNFGYSMKPDSGQPFALPPVLNQARNEFSVYVSYYASTTTASERRTLYSDVNIDLSVSIDGSVRCRLWVNRDGTGPYLDFYDAEISAETSEEVNSIKASTFINRDTHVLVCVKGGEINVLINGHYRVIKKVSGTDVSSTGIDAKIGGRKVNSTVLSSEIFINEIRMYSRRVMSSEDIKDKNHLRYPPKGFISEDVINLPSTVTEAAQYNAGHAVGRDLTFTSVPGFYVKCSNLAEEEIFNNHYVNGAAYDFVGVFGPISTGVFDSLNYSFDDLASNPNTRPPQADSLDLPGGVNPYTLGSTVLSPNPYLILEVANTVEDYYSGRPDVKPTILGVRIKQGYSDICGQVLIEISDTFDFSSGVTVAHSCAPSDYTPDYDAPQYLMFDTPTQGRFIRFRMTSLASNYAGVNVEWPFVFYDMIYQAPTPSMGVGSLVNATFNSGVFEKSTGAVVVASGIVTPDIPSLDSHANQGFIQIKLDDLDGGKLELVVRLKSDPSQQVVYSTDGTISDLDDMFSFGAGPTTWSGAEEGDTIVFGFAYYGSRVDQVDFNRFIFVAKTAGSLAEVNNVDSLPSDYDAITPLGGFLELSQSGVKSAEIRNNKGDLELMIRTQNSSYQPSVSVTLNSADVTCFGDYLFFGW